jgi:hypothetical protein
VVVANGDELMISDGTLTATGRWLGWMCFASTRRRPCSSSPTGWAQTMRASIGCSSTARWRSARADVEQLLATQPSELHALTVDLSAEETEALLLDTQRERARSTQQLHAEVHATWRREQELLDELSACWLNGALF